MVGAVAVLAVQGFVDGLLFGVEASDPATFGVAAILLVAVAVVAGAVPARRAARVDPVRVLRAE